MPPASEGAPGGHPQHADLVPGLGSGGAPGGTRRISLASARGRRSRNRVPGYVIPGLKRILTMLLLCEVCRVTDLRRYGNDTDRAFNPFKALRILSFKTLSLSLALSLPLSPSLSLGPPSYPLPLMVSYSTSGPHYDTCRDVGPSLGPNFSLSNSLFSASRSFKTLA